MLEKLGESTMHSVDTAIGLYRAVRNIYNDTWSNEYPIEVELKIVRDAIKAFRKAERDCFDFLNRSDNNEFHDSTLELILDLKRTRGVLEHRLRDLKREVRKPIWFLEVRKFITNLFRRYEESLFYSDSSLVSFRNYLIEKEKQDCL